MPDRRSFLKSSLSAIASGVAWPLFRFGSPDPLLRPPRLRRGDTVGIASPSGITWETDQLNIFRESLAVLGLKTLTGRHALDRWGYLAGKDEDRAREINDMFANPDVHAIFALAGGWGAARLLPLIDYEMIRRNPKVLLGFSDVTSLLIALYARCGLVTFHGPTGNSSWNTFTAGYVRRLLMEGEAVTFENPAERGDNLTPVENRIQTIMAGTARGRLVGGNLTVLSSILGSGYLPDWDGHILFVEDVGEDIYRVDRMLTQLDLAGVLQSLTGFVFGRCTRCEPDSSYSSFTLMEVLADHIRPLGIPAFYGSMIGHIRDKFTVPIGVSAEVDAVTGRIQLLEPSVA